MSQKQCKNCHLVINDETTACPSCGEAVAKKWGLGKRILVVLGGIGCIGIISTIFASANSDEYKQPKTPHQEHRDDNI